MLILSFPFIDNSYSPLAFGVIMQTLEVPTTAPAVSKFNLSWYIAVFVALISVAVWRTGSVLLAIGLIVGALALWILFETLAVTVYLHRTLTHGALVIKARWYTRFWLWWSRSGMVKFWEWVENHASHHANTDTSRDSYTPKAYMAAIDMPPLRPPRPWRYLDNARAYTRTAELFRREPEQLQEVADNHIDVRRALDRLDELSWARRCYGNTNRALVLNWAFFTVVSLPLALQLGAWWFLPVLLVVPWAMIGLKVYLYLLGGYIINYYGHQAEDKPHQSNVPWWLHFLTLFMMGEGWHEFHHDAPYAARFHNWLDPGWWTIWLSAKFRLVGNITVAARIAPRRYEPRSL